MSRKLWILARLKSFQFAWKGVCILFSKEENAKIHLFASLLVVGMGCLLSISAMEWIAVILCIGVVFAAEAFNSAIECLANYASPGHHHLIGMVKDLAAGAVLLVAVAAAIIGGIVFVPKLILLL